MKHQTPNTKLQESSKLQAPSSKGFIADLKLRTWSLVFEVSLKLEV
jgi:hypothetical protein